ncbi:protein trichome birefringence-like 28 isoform X2 [Andrographis paniculata]|uniref:protein trichome birefringence-like 28 isoform X2 n=1 Tax=Andrographis paniculata TaxID=175694 RepID=UPI0021E98B44|nr:protein trichome birefringence-like 28 isoform X2 [Andrographis paniculata]
MTCQGGRDCYRVIRKCNAAASPSITIITLISVMAAVLILIKDITFTARITLRWPPEYLHIIGVGGRSSTHPNPTVVKNGEVEVEEEGVALGCDLSKGRWVFDDVTRPLYKEEDCRFLTAQVTCIRNGRKDTMYQKWRWQPHQCSLPRFKARVLLEKLRGKRMMFVGDSLNRNQWESMVCLLQSAVAPHKASWRVGAPLSVFSLQEYNATVEFYWAPFLVESNSDDPRNHSAIAHRIIAPDSISNHGLHWKPADFLVFNTYIWWMNRRTIKVLRGGGPLADHGSAAAAAEFDELERVTAYERVMTTWANWVKHNIDHNRTSSFFVTMSPVHQESSNWNGPKGMGCALETVPIISMSNSNSNASLSLSLNMGTDRRLLEITRRVINATRIPVRLIDITTLSEYRKDAHTSVYTIRQGKLLTPEQKADPATYADCLHWCVPGLPDTWNQLLYAHIIANANANCSS